MRSTLSHARKSRGIAMVEFVISAPLCLFLLIAAIEFGRGFMQYNKMSKSIRDGARFAAEVARTGGGTTGVVALSATDRQRIRNLVVYGNIGGTGAPALPGMNASNVTVTVPGGGDIAVRAIYAYQPVFLAIEKFGLGTDQSSGFEFNNRITMRVL